MSTFTVSAETLTFPFSEFGIWGLSFEVSALAVWFGIWDFKFGVSALADGTSVIEYPPFLK